MKKSELKQIIKTVLTEDVYDRVRKARFLEKNADPLVDKIVSKVGEFPDSISSNMVDNNIKYSIDILSSLKKLITELSKELDKAKRM